MGSHIIVAGVTVVSRKDDKSKYQNHDGAVKAIRKNPHVIDVGFVPDIQLNSWYIT
jgi:hypothetical protein